VRGTGSHAGRVKAVETAMSFGNSGLGVEAWMEIRKARRYFSRCGRLRVESNWFTHLAWCGS
jgi:hypothetical protein